MTPSITTRAATEDDDVFLFGLFRAVRLPEFAHAPLAPAQLDLLLSIQYAGQKQSYGAEYPGGDEVVLLDGQAIGRIWLYRGAEEHHLVDIALMPEYRNRGIGSALVKDAIAGRARQGCGCAARWRRPIRDRCVSTSAWDFRWPARTTFITTWLSNHSKSPPTY